MVQNQQTNMGFGFSSGYRFTSTSRGLCWPHETSHEESAIGRAWSRELDPVASLPPLLKPRPLRAVSPLHSTPRPSAIFAKSLASGMNMVEPVARFGQSQRGGLNADSFLTDKQRQDRQRQRRLEENYKTVMCDFMRANKFCMFGESCRYAHSVEELRPKLPPPNHKTILCRNFTANNACPYGRKCRYIHRSPTEELQAHTNSSSSTDQPFEDLMNNAISQLDL